MNTNKAVILDALPFGVIVYGVPEGEDVQTIEPQALQITYVTPASDEITRAPMTSFVGMRGGDAFDSHDAAMPVWELVLAAIRTQEKQSLGVDLVYGDSNLPEAVYTIDAIPIDDRHAAVVFSNVSEQRVLEREKVHQQREAERFAYVASHDLQEPLRAIQTWLSFMQDDIAEAGDDPAAIRAAVETHMPVVLKSCDRQGHLIDSLLAVSRVGRAAINPTLLSLEKLVGDALSSLSQQIADTGAEITIDGKLPAIEADIGLMGSVVQNLVSNAIKFAKPGEAPKVRIGVGPGGRVEVEDAGIGIESQHLDRVWGMFRRLHGGSEYAGHGIGLTLARQIIEKHGGVVGVESELGRGSLFWFRLPDRGA